MARLFISYKREEAAYAFALRQWLMDVQGWASEDIFVDVQHLTGGKAWAQTIRAEAAQAEVMLFIASEASLDSKSFCHQELREARGIVLAVTIKDLAPSDERVQLALPHGATARQIARLDGPPTEIFYFRSPRDNSNGEIALNRRQVESIGETLRELGVAPDSFDWTYDSGGPFPGLEALKEGEEAIFFGRDREIAAFLGRFETMAARISERALIIQAPSGAGKSSFLRAGLWRRLRRHQSFTPLAIIRARGDALFDDSFGLARGLHEPAANHAKLSLGEIEEQLRDAPAALFAAIADADASNETGRRTLLIGVDQAEEIADLSDAEDQALARLFQAIEAARAADVDIRLVLTARDDSIEPTVARLRKAGLPHDSIAVERLGAMPAMRFREVIAGPVAGGGAGGLCVEA